MPATSAEGYINIAAFKRFLKNQPSKWTTEFTGARQKYFGDYRDAFLQARGPQYSPTATDRKLIQRYAARTAAWATIAKMQANLTPQQRWDIFRIGLPVADAQPALEESEQHRKPPTAREVAEAVCRLDGAPAEIPKTSAEKETEIREAVKSRKAAFEDGVRFGIRFCHVERMEDLPFEEIPSLEALNLWEVARADPSKYVRELKNLLSTKAEDDEEALEDEGHELEDLCALQERVLAEEEEQEKQVA